MKNPKLIVKPFAKNGQKNVIPENYEASMESNQATWEQGFGQITMLPVAAGGLPPKGQDFNGIFNQISENIVYLSQGGRFKFSAEYAESIGGYPKGAILQSDDEKKEYLSLIDNNKVDFNTATDINASWKLVNTDDLLAQIASKQPKGDYATKTELNSGLAGKQPTGDYATKTEVGLKLDKNSVVQSTGTSTANVMSQKSATDELKKKVDHAKYINDGANLPAEITSQGTGFYRTSATVTGTNIDSQLGYSLFWAINLSGNIGALCVNRLGNLYFSNDCATWERAATLENIKGFASTGDLLGNGQSYVDVTSSRNMNSVYKNTTGRTIFVIVTISRTSGSARADVKIDGVNIGAPVSSVTNGTASNSVCFPIPNGSSYSVSGSGSDVGLTWMELRA